MSVSATASAAPTSPAGGEKAGSLRPVLAVIPSDCYDRPVWRGLAVLARDLAFYAVAIVGLVLTDAWWATLLLWGLAGLSVAGLFVLGHDAAHQALFDSRRLNDVVARVTMLPSAHIAEAWVFGHNRVHHRHTVRRHIDFVWHPTTPDEWNDMGRGSRLLHRLEWSPFGSGFYYFRRVWWQKMIRFQPPEVRQGRIRRDRALVYVAHALAFGLIVGLVTTYGAGLGAGLWLWTEIVLVPFLLFCWFIGWTVHVHHIGPDLEWMDRGEWTKFKAQVESTTVLHAPWYLDVFFHSIFEHAPHHVDPRIPFFHLKRAGRAMVDAFPDNVVERSLSMRHFWHDARACKLYDFDRHRWVTYREVAVAP